MAAKLSEGDTITMTGEVTLVHDDGTVTVRLHGYDVPVTTRGEHLRSSRRRRRSRDGGRSCMMSRTKPHAIVQALL